MKSNHSIIIAGHRGYPTRFPENTLLSFSEAINCSCDMLETDVRATRDGALVLMHDASALRTTGTDRNICDMTFAEVKKLYAGDPALGCRIPTLEDFLSLCAPHKDLLMDIEIKSDLGKENAKYILENIAKLCKEFGVCDRVMINSFDFYVLKECRSCYGKTFVTHGYYPYSHMKNTDEDPTPYLDYACYWAKGEDIQKSCEYLISHGIKPCTGSNTTAEMFFEHTKHGCAMFTENDPESIIKLRNSIR